MRLVGTVLLPAALTPLWTRPAALTLANHPLFIQLGTGCLPRGSLERNLLARTAILDGLESAAGNGATSAERDELRALLSAEKRRCAEDTAIWRTQCDAAGVTIDLPASEVEAGVACYNCGGSHYNIDCPDELAVAPSAVAISAYLRSTSTLAAAAAVLRDLAFVASTLVRAGLGGGAAYGELVSAHAARLPELADKCELVLTASEQSDDARAAEEYTTARSLLYAMIDSESGVAGLKSSAAAADDDGRSGGAALSLQEAREAIEAIEPGFLQSQDRNAQFLREEVLGAQVASAPQQQQQQQRKAAAVDAAAAYLKAKQAANQPIGRDAQATLQDSRAALLAKQPGGGAKADAAKKYVALRKKQQAAQAYLAAKKAKEGGEKG